MTENKIGFAVKCPACDSLYKITPYGGEPLPAPDIAPEQSHATQAPGPAEDGATAREENRQDTAPRIPEIRCPACGLIGDFEDKCPSCGTRIGAPPARKIPAPTAPQEPEGVPLTVPILTFGSCLSVVCCPLLAVTLALAGLKLENKSYEKAPKIYRQLTALALVVGILMLIANIFFALAQMFAIARLK